MNRDMKIEFETAINTPLPESDGDWDDSSESEEEEDSIKIDRVPLLLFSVFDLIEFIINDLCLPELVQIDNDRIISLYMMLLGSLEQEVFFEHDLDFKVVQIELLVSLLKLLKAQPDFEELKYKLILLLKKCLSFLPNISEIILQHISNLK